MGKDDVRVLSGEKPAVSKQQCITQNLCGGLEQTQALCLVYPKWKDLRAGLELESWICYNKSLRYILNKYDFNIGN